MKNCQITTRLSIVAVTAASLLAFGIVTALSTVEQADALTNTQSATSSAS